MSIPREGSRDTGDGIIISITPDVCKTPVGSTLVPIPYSITAIQGDDANTVATVRMTGKRAHNMASLVTQCTGDAPGTGLGIKSGTVGSVCHPKTHSGSVRIRGEWAIRDNDMWEMNNRNTLGKLVYVKSKETFEETPAIQLTQNPDSRLPEGQERTDTVNAIIAGMERARAEGMPEGSYQVAQALPNIVTDAAPVVTRPLVPGGTTTIPVGPAANDNVRPSGNRIARPPATTSGSLHDLMTRRGAALPGARGLGLAGLAFALAPIGLQNLMNRDAGRLAENHGITLDPSDPYDSVILEEYTRNRGESELSRLYRGMDEEDAVAIVRQRQTEADALRAAQAEVTSENVRIEGEEKPHDPCDVRRYGSLVCPEGEQAHHIVPDSLLRYGNRTDGEAGLNRIPGMPSFRDGMAICLTGQASDPTSGHGIAHSVTDPMIAAAGALAPIPQTTTVATGVAAGIAGASAAKPECAAQITAAATTQFAGINAERLVNSANRPARGAALDALRQGL